MGTFVLLGDDDHALDPDLAAATQRAYAPVSELARKLAGRRKVAALVRIVDVRGKLTCEARELDDRACGVGDAIEQEPVQRILAVAVAQVAQRVVGDLATRRLVR